MRGLGPTLFSSTVLLLLLLTPVRARACACCSNEGDYYVGTGKPDEYDLSVARQMRFGPKARLYTTEAGTEELEKVLAHVAEEYALGGSLVGGAWKLSFRDGKQAGALSLPLPLKMTTYAADIRDGQTSPGGGPLLYKEWRFEGRASGTGFFKRAVVGPTRYVLVLQGRGNACSNAEDFKHWRLEISNRRAEFAFYGDLADPQ